MTEASPVITAQPSAKDTKVLTIGVPLPSTLVRVVDEDGYPLPQGEVGEL